MPTLAIQIPENVLAQYEIRAYPIQRLDESGELCQFCSRDGQYVDVQFYGRVLPEFATDTCLDQAHGSCCVDCLENCLRDAGVDPAHTVTVEYER